MTIDNHSITKHLSSSVTYAQELADILKPLFDQLEIKYFGYNRYFRNQSWMGLYSDPCFAEIDLSAGRGPIFVDAQGIRMSSGCYLHKDLPDLLKLDVDNGEVENFFDQADNPFKKVMQNGLLLVHKGVHYDETFYFSMLDGTIADRSYFYCIVNDLKKFSLYFLEKAKKLVMHAEQKRIKYRIPKNCDNTFSPRFIKHDDGADWIEVNKFCFATPFGDAFLSRQELNCLRQVAKGCSQDQISEKLGVSRRTVESYLINIKNKIVCWIEGRAHRLLSSFFDNGCR